MAYLEQNDEEQKLLEQQGAQPREVVTSGPSGVLDPGASGGTPTPNAGEGAQPAQPPGGGFTDIQQFLNANQPGAQKLAQQVAQGITQKGEAARRVIGQQQSAFGQQVGQNEIAQDPGLLNQITADPGAILKNPEQLAQLQKMRDATYQGPTQFEGTDYYGTAQQSVQDALNAGNATQNPGGLIDILAQMRAGSGLAPSRGALEFESSLLSGDPGARSTIEQARGGLSDLEQRLSDAAAASKERAAQAAATTAATQTATRGALSGATTALQQGVDTRLAATQQEARQRQQAVQAALGGAQGLAYQGQAPSGAAARIAAGEAPQTVQGHGGAQYSYLAPNVGGVSDQVLADLGITREQLADLVAAPGTQNATQIQQASRVLRGGVPNDAAYRVDYDTGLGDLGRYASFTSPEAQITRANIATPEDYARLAALSELSGQPNLYLNPADAALAGTANLDTSSFDLTPAQAQTAALLAQVEQERRALQAVNARHGGGGGWKPFTGFTGYGI